MEAKELSSRFYAYLKSLTENKIVGNWIFLGLTDKIYSSPGGGWDGVEGFLFQSKEFEYKYILRCATQNQYVVIESMNNDGGQLYNIGLNKNEIHKEIGDDSLIYESFNMTVGKGRKSVEEVKDAFRQLGITQNLISKIKNESPDWEAFINDLLGWAIYRESAKLILKKQPFEIEKIKNIQLSYHITQIMKQYQQILSNKPQIILQGPPGTGKTYTAKDIAEFMIKGKVSADKKEQKKVLEESDQFKLIQFHPSYTYEDFVRGIDAKPNEDGGGVLYEAVNKTLGKFAKKALENYQLSREDATASVKTTDFSSFVNFVIEQIGEHEKFEISDKVYIHFADDTRFKYKGDNWTAHPNGISMSYSELRKIIELGFNTRQEINKCDLLNALTRQHATYFQNVIELYKQFQNKQPVVKKDTIKEEKFILIIDEINRANLPAVLGELIYSLEYRGEALDGIYEIDENRKIVIPPNLYIIGTMNTADRSVGHIDYAIRRRFAFVDILPNTEPVSEFAKPLFKTVSELFVKNYEAINWKDPKLERSDYLASDFRPEDVWIGHSYFIAKTPEEFALKLKYEVVPILKEYLKDGILLEKARETIEKLLDDYARILGAI